MTASPLASATIGLLGGGAMGEALAAGVLAAGAAGERICASDPEAARTSLARSASAPAPRTRPPLPATW
jgi:pyrroline-5-carboxylate reductase